MAMAMVLTATAPALAEIVVLEEIHSTETVAIGGYWSKELDLETGDLIQLVLTRASGPNFDVYLLTDSQLTQYTTAVSGGQSDFGKPTDFTYEDIAGLSKWLTISSGATYHLVIDNTNASATGAMSTSALVLDVNLVLKRDVSGMIASGEDSSGEIILMIVLVFSILSCLLAAAAWAATPKKPKKVKKPDEDEDEE